MTQKQLFYLSVIFVTLCLGARANAQVDIYVAKDYGSDTNGGTSWQDAFATIDAAINSFGRKTSNGETYNIYISQGEYVIATGGGDTRAFEGSKLVNFYGGYPKPDANTPGDFTCVRSPELYPVSFSYADNDSAFRIGVLVGQPEVNSTDMHFEDINYSSTNTNGGPADGTFITVDNTANDSHISMKSMIISGYTSENGAFIFYYDASNSSFTVDKIHVSGGTNPGTASGGSFLRVADIGTFESSDMNVSVTNSTFTGNTLNGVDGGSLFQLEYNNQSSNNVATFIGNTFCNNRSTSGAVNGSVVRVNSGAGLVFQNNTFVDNKGDDGAVFLENTVVTQPFSNNTWMNNVATNNGGALHLVNTPVTIENNTFQTNTAQNNGGAIYISGASGGTYTIQNSVFCTNTATTVDGGAIDVAGATTSSIVTTNNYFEENTAPGADGGAIWSPAITSTNDQFYNNTAATGGGGAVRLTGGTASNFSGAVFNNNSASEGGAIYKSAGDVLTVSNSFFVSNKSTNSTGGGGAVHAAGAADFTSNTNIYDGNTAQSDGGAIYSEDIVKLTNDKFKDNQAKNSGGGLYFLTTADGSTIDGTIFTNNKALQLDGGAVHSDDGNMVITSSEFRGNTAGRDGGGYYSDTDTTNITGTLFYQNQAGTNGGAVYVQGESTFSTVQFIENQAGITGGAIYSLSALGSDDITLDTNSYSYGNTANGNATTPNSSEFRLPLNAGLYNVNMDIKDSQVQLAPTTVNYPAGSFSSGFRLTNVTQSTASTVPGQTITYTLPTVNGTCPAVGTITCPTAADVLPPSALITAGTDTSNPNSTSVICSSQNPGQITLFATSGKPVNGIKFEYIVSKIVNGADGSTTNSSTIQTGVSSPGSREFVYQLPANPTEGITYKVELLSVEDSVEKVTFSCSPRLSATVSVNPEPKFTIDPATTTACESATSLTVTATFAQTNTSITGAGWTDSTTATSWAWEDPNGNTVGGSTNELTLTSFTPASSGTYKVTVTDNNGCTKTETFDITINSSSANPFTAGTDANTSVGISTLNRDATNWMSANNGFIQLESQKYGFVPTRIAETNPDSAIDLPIANPVKGMVVWNTTKNCLAFYNGTEWKCASKGCN